MSYGGLKDWLFSFGTSQTTQEDRLCILFSCDVPVVLRYHEDGFWSFIGEAYVHGIMDGEALDGRYLEQVFEMV